MGSEGLRTALDTSVVIAALCPWHERHRAVAAYVSGLLESPASVILPAHVLVESYSVLTRLPSPLRVAPGAAWAALSGSFESVLERPYLDGALIARLLAGLASRGVAGGATYDALILAAAQRAGARRLATLNPRHYRGPLDGIEVVSPASEASE